MIWRRDSASQIYSIFSHFFNSYQFTSSKTVLNYGVLCCLLHNLSCSLEHRARPSQVTLDKDKSVASSNSSSVCPDTSIGNGRFLSCFLIFPPNILSWCEQHLQIPGSLPARVDLNKLREAKRFAVLQAQHEGCLGSYESFDSLFGNFLVPVIPTNDFFDQVGTKPWTRMAIL